MKKQVVLIHGGETFDRYEEYVDFLRAYQLDYSRAQGMRSRWQDSFKVALGEQYEVIQPTMPSKYNAKYLEWKIWFEKYIPFLRDGVIIAGTSLGGIFVAKYVSENLLPVRIAATFLIAAPHDAEGSPYSLADFVLPDSLALLAEQGGKVFLIHSKDDPVVKYVDVESYASRLPEAEQMIFEDRGHFSQETFPELIEKIKELAG